jgi:thiol-disulfide isomerase/thioredoxin
LRKVLPIVLLLSIFISCKKRINGKIFAFENTLFGDTAFGKTSGADALYFLKTDTVFNFQGIPYPIKIPNNLKATNLLWGSIYYTGVSKNQKNLFFLITDTTNNKLKILADKNGDLDFTDEELETFNGKNQFNITLKNTETKFEKFKVLVNIFSEEKSTRIARINSKMGFTQKHNCKIYRMVQEVRWNYKKLILPDSNVIVVQDYDCNGHFNNKKDKIYAYNPLVEKEVSLKQSSYFAKGCLLPFKNKSYELIDIDKDGSTIELKQTSIIIDFTNHFENIELEDLEKNKTDFKDLSKPNKITVLYFWGTWCSPCLQQTDSISAFYNSNKNMMNFYSIHYGGNIETIQKYKDLKKINFPIFKIDEANIKIAKVEGFPTFIIIDEKGVIIETYKNFYKFKKYITTFKHKLCYSPKTVQVVKI